MHRHGGAELQAAAKHREGLQRNQRRRAARRFKWKLLCFCQLLPLPFVNLLRYGVERVLSKLTEIESQMKSALKSLVALVSLTLPSAVARPNAAYL